MGIDLTTVASTLRHDSHNGVSNIPYITVSVSLYKDIIHLKTTNYDLVHLKNILKYYTYKKLIYVNMCSIFQIVANLMFLKKILD